MMPLNATSPGQTPAASLMPLLAGAPATALAPAAGAAANAGEGAMPGSPAALFAALLGQLGEAPAALTSLTTSPAVASSSTASSRVPASPLAAPDSPVADAAPATPADLTAADLTATATGTVTPAPATDLVASLAAKRGDTDTLTDTETTSADALRDDGEDDDTASPLAALALTGWPLPAGLAAAPATANTAAAASSRSAAPLTAQPLKAASPAAPEVGKTAASAKTATPSVSLQAATPIPDAAPFSDALASTDTPAAATHDQPLADALGRPLAQTHLAPVAASAAQASPDIDLPQPALQSPSWSQAAGERIAWMVRGEQPSAILHITPEALGPIQVRIDLHEQGARIALAADQGTTRALLESHLPRLTASLESQGVRVDQIVCSSQPIVAVPAPAQTASGGSSSDNGNTGSNASLAQSFAQQGEQGGQAGRQPFTAASGQPGEARAGGSLTGQPDRTSDASGMASTARSPARATARPLDEYA